MRIRRPVISNQSKDLHFDKERQSLSIGDQCQVSWGKPEKANCSPISGELL